MAQKVLGDLFLQKIYQDGLLAGFAVAYKVLVVASKALAAQQEMEYLLASHCRALGS